MHIQVYFLGGVMTIWNWGSGYFLTPELGGIGAWQNTVVADARGVWHHILTQPDVMFSLLCLEIKLHTTIFSKGSPLWIQKIILWFVFLLALLYLKVSWNIRTEKITIYWICFCSQLLHWVPSVFQSNYHLLPAQCRYCFSSGNESVNHYSNIQSNNGKFWRLSIFCN